MVMVIVQILSVPYVLEVILAVLLSVIPNMIQEEEKNKRKEMGWNLQENRSKEFQSEKMPVLRSKDNLAWAYDQKSDKVGIYKCDCNYLVERLSTH